MILASIGPALKAKSSTPVPSGICPNTRFFTSVFASAQRANLALTASFPQRIPKADVQQQCPKHATQISESTQAFDGAELQCGMLPSSRK
jgi:hypothetical protein